MPDHATFTREAIARLDKLITRFVELPSERRKTSIPKSKIWPPPAKTSHTVIFVKSNSAPLNEDFRTAIREIWPGSPFEIKSRDEELKTKDLYVLAVALRESLRDGSVPVPKG